MVCVVVNYCAQIQPAANIECWAIQGDAHSESPGLRRGLLWERIPWLAPGAFMRASMQARSASDGICRHQTSASGSVASPNVFCGTPILSSIER